jgi:hypothetical protein
MSHPALLVAVLIVCAQSGVVRISSADVRAPFDADAARQALEGVDLASCGVKHGSDGHISVTFGPTGRVTYAVIDRGPLPATRAGRCLLTRYRKIIVPAFTGEPVKVGKKFHVD